MALESGRRHRMLRYAFLGEMVKWPLHARRDLRHHRDLPSLAVSDWEE